MDDSSILTEEKVDTKNKYEKQYKVILINDDYTPQDFVVMLLETIFKKSPSEAVKIMLQIHNHGSSVCGIYSKQIAEVKVEQVKTKSRSNKFPLKCDMEEVL